MNNTTKWLSLESNEQVDIFNQSMEICTVTLGVTRMLLEAERKWNPGMLGDKLSGHDYVLMITNIQSLEQVAEYLSKLVKAYYSINPKLARICQGNENNHILLSKRNESVDALCRQRFTLLLAIHTLVTTILKCCLHREDTRKLMELSFSYITLYNELLALSSKVFVSKYNICSNACPNVLTQTKKISITKIVQVLAQSRAELDCERLIDCFVQNYKNTASSSDYDQSSNASSLEIYHTLTKHMEPAMVNIVNRTTKQLQLEKKKVVFSDHSSLVVKSKSLVDIINEQNIQDSDEYIISGCVQTSDSEVPYLSLLEIEPDTRSFDHSQNETQYMLRSEEIYVEILLDTAVRMAPAMLGNDGVKKMKSGEVRVSGKSSLRVMEYYQNILWGEVGSFLEHVVLWWGGAPLAARSPRTSQNLREWLSSFNSNNTPVVILAALRSLADALGVHVASTSWDNLFGMALVTNLGATTSEITPELSLYVTECTETGAHFAIMLQDLVSLSNQCEMTGEYILGAPVDELPLVEQIPILHRLDHSIHTCRLWSLAETRRLANIWDMKSFFRVAHNDIQTCLEQLSNLRFADHTSEIDSGKVGVHEHVCGKMREKLVSEIRVNIQKLRESPEECMDVLASVCATTSLAQLTIVFPSQRAWRDVTRAPDVTHSQYVPVLLDKVLLPVLKATQEKLSVNMVLRIMCESWLHHIYVSKVKFSNAAALQLLADFDAVRLWINECSAVTNTTRKQLLNNEVLRRCEGVGRLLLHSPGDPISMWDSTASQAATATLQTQGRTQASPEESEAGQSMPAEMYVPNQQQWLALRSAEARVYLATLCCGASRRAAAP